MACSQWVVKGNIINRLFAKYKQCLRKPAGAGLGASKMGGRHPFLDLKAEEKESLEAARKWAVPTDDRQPDRPTDIVPARGLNGGSPGASIIPYPV